MMVPGVQRDCDLVLPKFDCDFSEETGYFIHDPLYLEYSFIIII